MVDGPADSEHTQNIDVKKVKVYLVAKSTHPSAYRMLDHLEGVIFASRPLAPNVWHVCCGLAEESSAVCSRGLTIVVVLDHGGE